MKRQLTDLLPRSRDLLRRTQKVLASVALAAYAIVGAVPAGASQAPASSTPIVNPTIVDRSKKAAKLVLALPGKALNHFAMQHRSHSSHRSHASHASHKSHYSGATGVAAPPRPEPPKPPPAAKTDAATSNAAAPVPLIDFGGVPWFEGVIEGVDRLGRTLRVRALSPESRFTISVKDDTMVERSLGLRMRFDDYLEAHSGQYPFGVGDKVQLSWRQNPTTKTSTAVTIVRAK